MNTIYSADQYPQLAPEARAQLEADIEASILAYEAERDELSSMGIMPAYENDAEREYNCELLRSYGFDPDEAEFDGDEEE